MGSPVLSETQSLSRLLSTVCFSCHLPSEQTLALYFDKDINFQVFKVLSNSSHSLKSDVPLETAPQNCFLDSSLIHEGFKWC